MCSCPRAAKAETLYISRTTQSRKHANKIEALDELVRTNQLTQAGRDYVVQALDPFHDWTFKAVGLPDSNGDRSVIVCVHQALTVETRDAVDMHVVMLPTLTTDYYENATVTGLTVTSTGDNYGPLGTLNVIKVPAGFPTFPDYNSPVDIAASGGEIFTLDASEYSINTSLRVVSAGFEVHNTSPEVFKSGSVVVYRMPQTKHLTGARMTDISPEITQAYRARLPPHTQASALAHPGSRQWEAYDGNYNVAIISHPETAHLRDYNSMIYMSRDTIGDTDPINALYIKPTTATTVGRLYPSIDLCGAYYAGLQPGSTLTVTLKLFLEIFPTGQDGVVQLLAQPSPAHDSVALDIYARAVGRLPPGCKVDDNSGGDWWRAAVDVVNTVAPRAGAAMETMGRVARPIKSVLAKRKQKAGNVINDNSNFGEDSLKSNRGKNKEKLINKNRK